LTAVLLLLNNFFYGQEVNDIMTRLPCDTLLTANHPQIEIMHINADRCLYSDQWVINSQREFDSIMNKGIQVGKCIEYDSPSIDYSKHTLVGHMISFSTNCIVESIKSTIKLSCEKKTLKLVTEIYCPKSNLPKTKIALADVVWIKLPKISREYDVTLEFREVIN